MVSSSVSNTGWSRIAFVALMLAAQGASATYTCVTESNYYPYCVNVPNGASNSSLLPTILFLSGSGARNSGSGSQVQILSGYDGFGKKVNEYLSGNKGPDQTMAATQFITIIPISPMTNGSTQVRHWWPQYLDTVLAAVKAKYPVDEDRIHCVGYSMGARGCWRYATNRPSVLASTSSHAGAAESPGDSTLTEQAAPATFPLLNLVTSLPVWQFDGSQDTTAGTAQPIKTQQQLVELGSMVSQLTTENTDHSGMSTVAYDTTLMIWLLKQRRSGSSSTSTANTTTKGISTVNAVDEFDVNGVSSGLTSNMTSATNTDTTATELASSMTSPSTSKCASRKRSNKRSHVSAPARSHIIPRSLTLEAPLKARSEVASPSLISKDAIGLYHATHGTLL